MAAWDVFGRVTHAMIITEVLGNREDLSEKQLASLTEERVVLDNLTLLKRIQRVETDQGRELGLRLPSAVRELRDGDILYQDDDLLITVEAEPTDVLVLRPKSMYDMGVYAHTLGNRHLQAQFFGPDSAFGETVMVVQYDHTVQEYLDAVGAPYTREGQVMPRAFRHAEHTH